MYLNSYYIVSLNTRNKSSCNVNCYVSDLTRQKWIKTRYYQHKTLDLMRHVIIALQVYKGITWITQSLKWFALLLSLHQLGVFLEHLHYLSHHQHVIYRASPPLNAELCRYMYDIYLRVISPVYTDQCVRQLHLVSQVTPASLKWMFLLYHPKVYFNNDSLIISFILLLPFVWEILDDPKDNS